MGLSRLFQLGFCLMIFAMMSSCSKKKVEDTAAAASFAPPAVAPIVNAALPAALKAASTTVAIYSAPLTGAPGIIYHQEYLELFDKNEKSQAFSYYKNHYAPLSSVIVTNTNSTLAKDNISNLFKLSFNDINDGNIQWQGYLNTQVIQIDERMKDAPVAAGMPCLADAAKSYNVDLSEIDPMLDFTLDQLQCWGAMGSDPNGATGGIAFGQQGANCATAATISAPSTTPAAATTPAPFTPGSTTGGCNFSLMLSLTGLNSTFDASGGFLVLSNIVNAGSTTAAAPQYVDALSTSYSPQSQNNRVTVARFRAVPSLNTFELHYAATDAFIAGVNSDTLGKAFLGAGFRMISDGVHIYADGKVLQPGSWPTPEAWVPFNVCLNASDNSVVTLASGNNQSECDALANSFSLSTSGTVDFTYYDLTGTDVGSAIPGMVANQQQTPPSAAVIALLKRAYNMENVSSAASKRF